MHSRGLRPNRVEFNINVLDRKNGSVNSRPQNLWQQHEGFKDAKGEDRVVDVGVLLLESHVADYQEIRDDIAALVSHMIVILDEAGQPSRFPSRGV